MRKITTLVDRYNTHVIKQQGCWGWSGAVINRGPYSYGVLQRGRRGEGLILAHRASWEIHVGPIPEGKLVLHRCDNPICSNPEHLFLGTQTDNMQDCVRKGRHNQASKTHCKNGHPLGPRRGRQRVCPVCARAAYRRYQQRHSEWM